MCNDRSSHSRILLGLYVVMLLSMSIQLDYVLLLFYIIQLMTTDNYHIIPMIGTDN